MPHYINTSYVWKSTCPLTNNDEETFLGGKKKIMSSLSTAFTWKLKKKIKKNRKLKAWGVTAVPVRLGLAGKHLCHPGKGKVPCKLMSTSYSQLTSPKRTNPTCIMSIINYNGLEIALSSHWWGQEKQTNSWEDHEFYSKIWRRAWLLPI